MDFMVKYWAEQTDYEALERCVRNRKIAVWGAYIGGKQIRNILEEHGLKVSFYIDGHKKADEYDNLPIIRPSEHINKDDIYILIAVIGVRQEITRYLGDWDMAEGSDYTYISQKTPWFTITECSEGGMKCNDNFMQNTEEVKCTIKFVGFGSKVKVGRGFQALASARITMESGSELVIGDDVTLGESVRIEVLAGGVLKIGNGCQIGAGSRISVKGSQIILGNYISVGERFCCMNAKSTSITIGNDCMFSHDVSIIAGGHSIFDLDAKENVSMKHQKHVKIGNHVWIGKNGMVLHNAEIGNGCVVGASSVVKLKTEDNCILAGNPARIVKTNHTWDRRNDIEFEDI